jgi:hypothetical protein
MSLRSNSVCKSEEWVNSLPFFLFPECSKYRGIYNHLRKLMANFLADFETYTLCFPSELSWGGGGGREGGRWR